ncbi:protein DCL chloroplastic [Prunus yedoensis var. nudiflora]|uniref:Protein DCL chloroplastic n=1 Tax=Prunus yedoensis var. nudiflora TaxID=2094558 RepID=A0A314ZDP4_PRUYE|nr:protein DCL chloroplastic [Prunus yedoensis var. nudiflora]
MASLSRSPPLVHHQINSLTLNPCPVTLSFPFLKTTALQARLCALKTGADGGAEPGGPEHRDPTRDCFGSRWCRPGRTRMEFRMKMKEKTGNGSIGKIRFWKTRFLWLDS